MYLFVIADLSKITGITAKHLERVGYKYDASTDKWNISDAAADIFLPVINY